ncbi:MAG: hypothetical protein Q4G00_06050 [Clostridia bacterium]|nr:hypothetical protein [Clostridia bacterium]
MASEIYDRLSREGKVLLDEAANFLEQHYDPASHYVTLEYEGQSIISVRESMYYALALMIKNKENAWEEIEKICHAVIALQINAPREVFHGVFRHSPEEPTPPMGQLDAQRLGLFGRYYADYTHEQITDAFHQKLTQDPRLADYTEKIEALLNASVLETVPVVWDTYEPNIREFILMCFAMLQKYGEKRMSPALSEELNRSARLAMEGAITRSKSNFTPLNTNIQCMHIFLLDFYGERFHEISWQDYAVSYAQKMLERYRECHACAEFNSPTYCGVDLSTLGFLRRYSHNQPLKLLAEELEKGIWRDMAEFYNPAMRNFCGPYSRAYELDMSIHTCFCDILYWALGEDHFPWHPFSIESVINPLTVLGDVRIPEDVKQDFLVPKQEQILYHRFRELSERGDPDHNSALCTATGWITPDLMTGALSGSENPSYQLHPLVVFWRQQKGLGTIKLLRCLPDGKMTHLHTIFFDGKADKSRITMDISVQVRRDVDIFFEIEAHDLERILITDSEWHFPGLDVCVKAQAPQFKLNKINERTIRIVYPSRTSDPASRTMHFDFQFRKTES